MSLASILVVEDEIITALELEENLTSFGYQVVSNASSSEEAIALVKDYKPDLILMDIRLQGTVDGIEAAKFIREQYQIPVIYLTAFADDETISRAKLSQPFGYLLKPVQERDLKVSVEMALYSAETEREKRKITEALRWESTVNQTLAQLSKELIFLRDNPEPFTLSLLDRAKSLTGSKNGFVALLDLKTGELVSITQGEISGQDSKELSIKESLNPDESLRYHNLWGHALNTGHSFFTNDPLSHPGTKESPELHQEIERFLSVPVFIDKKPVALIALSNAKQTYTSNDLRLIEQMAELLANVIFRNQSLKEKRELRSQLAHTRKLEAIGTLSGGIAHDFNNVLQNIIGYASVGFRNTDKESSIHGYFDTILQASQRAKELVQQILRFSQNDNQPMKTVQLKPIISEVIKLLRFGLPSTIEIITEIENHCGTIKAEETQIHQILMNLSSNALQAMENRGGRLTIKLERVALSETESCTLDLPPGPYNCLTVSDTGIGIHPTIRDRIFDPYFTTKEKTKGTGLGLSVVMGIVKSHKGQITVNSEDGKGTTFKIFFPETEEISELISEKSVQQIDKGVEHILIVDDEKTVLLVEKVILESLGYRVTDIDDSQKALALFKANPKRFDLVITDYTMPNMTGDDLSVAMLSIQPNLPIILCTGYSPKIDEKKAKKLGIKACLMKPVTDLQLVSAVQKALDYDTSDQPQDNHSQKISSQPVPMKVLTKEVLRPVIEQIPATLSHQLQDALMALNLDLSQKYISQLSSIDQELSQYLRFKVDRFQFAEASKLLRPSDF